MFSDTELLMLYMARSWCISFVFAYTSLNTHRGGRRIGFINQSRGVSTRPRYHISTLKVELPTNTVTSLLWFTKVRVVAVVLSGCINQFLRPSVLISTSFRFILFYLVNTTRGAVPALIGLYNWYATITKYLTSWSWNLGSISSESLLVTNHNSMLI